MLLEIIMFKHDSFLLRKYSKYISWLKAGHASSSNHLDPREDRMNCWCMMILLK